MTTTRRLDARRGLENPPRWHLCDPAAFPVCPDCLAKEV